MLDNIFPDRVKAFVYMPSFLGHAYGKTGYGVINHSELFDVKVVLDGAFEGTSTDGVWEGLKKVLPVVKTLDEVFKYDVQVMVLGVAPPGGSLPASWIEDINSALTAGMDVVSGLHEHLKSRKELAQVLSLNKGRLIEVRHPEPLTFVPPGSRGELWAKVLLVAGTDCAVGKRTTAVEIYDHLRDLEVDAGLVFTGQTGIMLGLGIGYPLDAVVFDFVVPTIETLIYMAAEKGHELLIVEGQGGLFHPQASCGALSLLHGCDPDGIILCHDPSRNYCVGFPKRPLYRKQTLQREIEAYRYLTPISRQKPYEILAITTYASQLKKLQKESPLPVFNPIEPTGGKQLAELVAKSML